MSFSLIISVTASNLSFAKFDPNLVFCEVCVNDNVNNIPTDTFVYTFVITPSVFTALLPTGNGYCNSDIRSTIRLIRTTGADSDNTSITPLNP